jgi:hypothetical protein
LPSNFAKGYGGQAEIDRCVAVGRFSNPPGTLPTLKIIAPTSRLIVASFTLLASVKTFGAGTEVNKGNEVAVFMK